MTSILRSAVASGAALSLALGGASAFAAAPGLPPVERSLTAAAGSCASTTYKAPMSGFVTARLNARKGDWDLKVSDAATRRTLATSAGFGASEVAQSWVQYGQSLVVRGCRERGSKRATTSIRFLDVEPPKATRSALVRIAVPDKNLIDALDREGLDVTHSMGRGWADVLVPDASKIDVLDKLGAKYEVLQRDMGEYFAKSRAADRRYARLAVKSPLPSGRTGYRRPEDYQAELKQLAEQYPGFVKPLVIGTSFQGREIQGVEISRNVNRTDDGRPTFFLMGTHHAREWPSGEIAMEFAWMLAKNRQKGEIADLLGKQRIVIVPLVNPDGYFASRAAAEDGMFPDPADTTGAPEADTVEGVAVPFGGNLAYRRKNCNGPVPGLGGAERDYPCYYQWGVDPNRNYGEGWGGPGASPDPNTQTHRGEGQWSEPETRAVHEFSQSRPVTNLISMHTVAALVLRPPGLSAAGKTPDELRMRELGDAMGEVTNYTSQYGFQLYDTSGTTEDWNYAAAGTFGYTIEIGPANGAFHGPYETAVVDEWNGPPVDPQNPDGERKGGMREALLMSARSAANPKDHSVIAGRAKPGLTLRLKKEFETSSAPVCTYAQGYVRAGTVPPLDCIGAGAVRKFADSFDYTTVVKPNGTFDWHVTPSTRPFVGGRFVEGERTDRTITFDGEGVAAPGAAPVSHEFEVTPEDLAQQMDLRLDVKGEDYNVHLSYLEADGSKRPIGQGQVIDGVLFWTAPGSGVNYPAMNEHITLANPPVGRYVAEVSSRAGIKNDWTMTVELQGQKEGHAESTGQKEAYTLTCETADGTVLGSRQVVVDRGQRLFLGMPEGCRS